MVKEISDISSIKKGRVLIDFYTSTCKPCRALNPVLEEISEECKDITVAKIEVTKNPDATQMFGVMSVPTVMLLQDSKIQEISYGFSGKEAIYSMLRKHVVSA